MLEEAEARFVFEDVAAPPVPSLLRGFSAPVKLKGLSLDQLRTLATGHQSFYSDVRAELLGEVAAIAPEGLTRSFLSNSGAEAIEAARRARRLG